MEKFTASNGVKVWIDGFGGIKTEASTPIRWVITKAIREFFQHERDKELGRWRWPENPDYVVYPIRQLGALGKPAARLLRESSCDVSTHGRNDSGMPEPVRAYFAAHPVPKPWHDAKPGEVWACVQPDHPGEEHAYWVNDNGSFIDVYDGGGLYGDDRECIESARRIWPDENSCSTP